MKWYVIHVELSLPLLESTYSFLWSYAHGLTIEKKEQDFLLKAYLFSPNPHGLAKKLHNFLNIMAKSFKTTYTEPSVNPLRLNSSDEFVIVPTPAAYVPPLGITIHIQRGRAFGTGSHPCTVYCLHALKDILGKELCTCHSMKILDAGTGTGILSIAAAKLGAKEILGAEIVRESYEEAQENVRMNRFSAEIKILPVSVTEITGHFDLILANLYGTLLIEIAPFLINNLAHKGTLVLGGMSVPQDDIVIAAFLRHGLSEYFRFRDEAWSASILQKH
jgi:ribosomal protein L11 methylase PrmA